MNENEKIHIDYGALINQITDKVVTGFISELMPDEDTRKILMGILAIHRKYGIDAVTSIKILQDMAKLTDGNKNEGDIT